jgi:hypothetical protein
MAVRDDQSGAAVAAVSDHGCPATAAFTLDSSHAAVIAVAGQGRPTATTSRVSASMTTWWLVEYR